MARRDLSGDLHCRFRVLGGGQPDVGQKAFQVKPVNCALIGKDALDNQLPAFSAAKAKKNYKRGEARKAKRQAKAATKAKKKEEEDQQFWDYMEERW